MKLSEIADGGAINAATDKVVVVRSGTTDLLATPVDLATAQALSNKTLASPKITGAAPASASAAGVAGTMVTDGSFIYVCTATNTWKRAAISTW